MVKELNRINLQSKVKEENNSPKLFVFFEKSLYKYQKYGENRGKEFNYITFCTVLKLLNLGYNV